MTGDGLLPDALRRNPVPHLSDRPGIFELAMRYGDLRAQAAAGAAHARAISPTAGGNPGDPFSDEPYAVAYRQAVTVADALAEVVAWGVAPPATMTDTRRRELEKHCGRFTELLGADPLTDPGAHAALTVFRRLLDSIDAALEAEGISRTVRDRAVNTVLFGQPGGPHARVDLDVLADLPPVPPEALKRP